VARSASVRITVIASSLPGKIAQLTYGISLSISRSFPAFEFQGPSSHTRSSQLLLDHGADVNVQKADLWAPLHHASGNGHLKVAESLLERGAEVDVQNEDQQTPLRLASANGEYEVARLLIKHGSNVNSQETCGWTPLHSAARKGHLRVDVVKLLLDSGVQARKRVRVFVWQRRD
jgi:ankyrin repeat protein